jgi:dinuclear metal center YbgI/SA1388 family protein
MLDVPTVAEIVAKLAGRTRPENASVWDPVGLQLGDPNAVVESVGVCHEVTEALVESLRQQPVDLLVTYHPLLFAKTNHVVAGRSAEARAFSLIQLDVNLMVTHTDFDAMPGGTADALASVFKLREISPFGGDAEAGQAHIGRYGAFEGTLAVVDAMTADAFGSAGLRISGDPSKKVETLAVLPGSGSEFLEEAAGVADAIVTGDVGHHRAVRALDLGLSVVDPGHIATERPGMDSLRQLVDDVAGVTVVDLTGLDPKTWS